MLVTWTTFNQTESWVEYGLGGQRVLQRRAQGRATLFVDGGEEKRRMYIHRVTLIDLKPAAAYGGSVTHADTTRKGLFIDFSVRYLTHIVCVPASLCWLQCTTVAVIWAGATGLLSQP